MANDRYVLIPAGAYTVAQSSLDMANADWSGGHFVVNCSAMAVSGSLTLKIEGKNEYTDAYYTLLTSSGIQTTGATLVKIYPGLTAGTNVANDFLPARWRVSTVHTGGTINYSVYANLQK